MSEGIRELSTFCRICPGNCGLIASVDAKGKLLKLLPDRANARTRGYTCFKGLVAVEAHNSPERNLHTLKRCDDGNFIPIAVEDALDEVAAKLRTILDEHGPQAIATYLGGGGVLTSNIMPMLQGFRDAIGTNGNFTNLTIDQSCKLIAADRLGVWAAGRQPLESSDVLLLVGANPLVSLSTYGAIAADPLRTIKEAKARGTKLIVVDPRRTETARLADIHLQIKPGENVTLAAGMIRMIIAENWLDADFCAAHIEAGQLDRLKQAVEPFTPSWSAQKLGISEEELRAATRMFAKAGRGSAFTGTGVTLSADSNLAEHMIELLNVACGRYKREGEPFDAVAPWLPDPMPWAGVIAPTRAWESEPPGRIRGANLLAGERLTCTLPDEILTPGPGQIMALINEGGNPATLIPDRPKVQRAFRSLDLLVSIEPYMTDTARLSHYIFAPKMQYERSDVPMALVGLNFNSTPFAQFTPAVATPPPGSELVDDAYVFWALAKRLGLGLNYLGFPLDMETPPDMDDLHALRCRGSWVPLEEIRAQPHGKIYNLGLRVQPASDVSGKFHPMPDDVADDLIHFAARSNDSSEDYPYRLVSRRLRDFCNSIGTLEHGPRKRNRENFAFVHPADLSAEELAEGDEIEIISDHGRIRAHVKPDETLRRGVVSVTHGFDHASELLLGGATRCANVNNLVSNEQAVEPINAMARMSAIPIRIRSINADAPMERRPHSPPKDEEYLPINQYK